MSQPYPYSDIRLPNDAPFELNPSSAGKGWGVFATKDIKQGVTVLTENPLFHIRKHPSDMPYDGQRQFMCLRANGDANKIFSTWDGVFAEKPHSRFNHSCLPNAKFPDTTTVGEGITSIAVKDIKAGEEINICYNTDFQGRTSNEHRIALRFSYQLRLQSLCTWHAQPATYGHIQTIANLVDEWGEVMWWGDKGQNLKVRQLVFDMLGLRQG